MRSVLGRARAFLIPPTPKPGPRGSKPRRRRCRLSLLGDDRLLETEVPERIAPYLDVADQEDAERGPRRDVRMGRRSVEGQVGGNPAAGLAGLDDVVRPAHVG